MASKGSGGVQFTSLRCVADHWIGVPRAQILGEKMDVSSLVAVVICGDLMVIHHGIYRIYIYICIYIYMTYGWYPLVMTQIATGKWPSMISEFYQ